MARVYAGPMTTPNAISAPRMLGSATDGSRRSVPSTSVFLRRNR
jgi:hypothetical protein